MTYWYVATPYTGYPNGPGAAFALARLTLARLTLAGVPAYSPIVHNHPLARLDGFESLGHDDWMRIDRPMMEAAHGLIVVRGHGWRESRGVTAEREFFSLRDRPILYIDPDSEPLPLHRLALLGPATRYPEAPRAPLATDMVDYRRHAPLNGVPGCVDGRQTLPAPHDA